MIGKVHTLLALSVVAVATPAYAQCDAIDFEQYGDGTPITTQYPGVTFSAAPGSCGGPGSVDVVIETPSAGTSSGTRCIATEQGCPEFSPDWIVMTFDNLQSEVTFTTGSIAGTSVVARAYSSSGALVDIVDTDTIPGCFTFVRLTGTGGAANIAWIEVAADFSFDEWVDDLLFDADTTPPLVEIDSPTFDQCVCHGSLVTVFGSVSDPDGTYGCDSLHYRPINADEDDPWVFVSSACGPFSGALHAFDTTPLAPGRYYLRVTGNNACGLESSDVTVIRIDASPPSLAFTEPTDGETVCGEVEFWGTVCDGCGITWDLKFEHIGSGVDGTIAQGESCVSGCRIATWDTTGLPDGDYLITMSATDSCGHSNSLDVQITVDNTNCDECGPDLNGDGFVNVADLLILLGAWS